MLNDLLTAYPNALIIAFALFFGAALAFGFYIVALAYGIYILTKRTFSSRAGLPIKRARGK
jgi:hypothetical protein